MLTAGDEFGRTQSGNNNAYAQDNDITWLDWKHADRRLAEIVGTLVALRKELAEFLDDSFLDNGNATWHGGDGKPKNWADSSKRTLTLVIAGTSRRIAIHVTAGAAFTSMAVPPRSGGVWRQIFSTNDGTFSHPHAVSVFEERPAT